MLDVIQQQLINEHGDGCYDLINRMIDPNPDKRPTAAEILGDQYFSQLRVIARDLKARYRNFT